MKVSVILPTYNEAGNIVSLVREILKNLEGYQAEVIIADDNSPDHTFEILQKAFVDDPRVKPILRLTNPGLANSLGEGVAAATGDQIVVMDSDCTHDPAEIPRLLHVAEIYDIVIGSRFAPGGNMQDQAHYLASLAYNFLLRVILRTQIQDNLGGYFTMSSENLRKLNHENIFFGYGEYFFRLLHDAQDLGLSVVEIPAHYKVRVKGVSKSNFFRLLFQYLNAAIRVRFGGNFRQNRRPVVAQPNLILPKPELKHVVVNH